MNTTVFERHRVSENVLSHSLSSSVLSPFWVEDAGVDSTLPTLQGTLACDLAIVGAGTPGYGQLLKQSVDTLNGGW